jgi:phosphoribosyl 1,2-cyclic phosphodiesterase
VRVIALASGSSGNATLVSAGEVKVLIDAGIPTKALERCLKQLSIAPSELAAIFLTHEHGDHVASAGVIARRYRVPVVANEETLREANLGKVQSELLPAGGTIKVGSLRVHSFRLPHDGSNPVGYWIEHAEGRVCLATDLGHTPLELREYVRAADLVILEANHERSQLIAGSYPSSLKARIIGDSGHLSNQQAAECLVASASGRPQWLWLAHLSAMNNSPRRAMRTVTAALRQAGIDSIRVGVALRDRRSLIWDSDQCFVQLRMNLTCG